MNVIKNLVSYFLYFDLFELVSYPFRYTRQVIDETLRASVVAPWGARVYEYDLQVDEFVIPKEVCSLFYPGTLFKLVTYLRQHRKQLSQESKCTRSESSTHKSQGLA